MATHATIGAGLGRGASRCVERGLVCASRRSVATCLWLAIATPARRNTSSLLRVFFVPPRPMVFAPRPLPCIPGARFPHRLARHCQHRGPGTINPALPINAPAGSLSRFVVGGRAHLKGMVPSQPDSLRQGQRRTHGGHGTHTQVSNQPPRRRCTNAVLTGARDPHPLQYTPIHYTTKPQIQLSWRTEERWGRGAGRGGAAGIDRYLHRQSVDVWGIYH